MKISRNKNLLLTFALLLPAMGMHAGESNKAVELLESLKQNRIDKDSLRIKDIKSITRANLDARVVSDYPNSQLTTSYQANAGVERPCAREFLELMHARQQAVASIHSQLAILPKVISFGTGLSAFMSGFVAYRQSNSYKLAVLSALAGGGIVGAIGCSYKSSCEQKAPRMQEALEVTEYVLGHFMSNSKHKGIFKVTEEGKSKFSDITYNCEQAISGYSAGVDLVERGIRDGCELSDLQKMSNKWVIIQDGEVSMLPTISLLGQKAFFHNDPISPAKHIMVRKDLKDTHFFVSDSNASSNENWLKKKGDEECDIVEKNYYEKYVDGADVLIFAQQKIVKKE